MRGVDQFAPMQLQPRDRTFLPGTRRLAAAAGSPAEADGHALGKSAESRRTDNTRGAEARTTARSRTADLRRAGRSQALCEPVTGAKVGVSVATEHPVNTET
jgi:hypothetical protein